jgi:hypothetical protein
MELIVLLMGDVVIGRGRDLLIAFLSHESTAGRQGLFRLSVESI